MQWRQILSAVLAMGEQVAVWARSCSDIQHFRSGRQLRGLLRDPSVTPDHIEREQFAAG
jgi:hypothetical protein